MKLNFQTQDYKANNGFNLTLLLSRNLLSLRSASFAPMYALQVKRMLGGHLRCQFSKKNVSGEKKESENMIILLWRRGKHIPQNICQFSRHKNTGVTII